MSFIRRIEEAAAKKLRRIFLDAKKSADYAVSDVAKAEKTLADAKIKAAEETKRAHVAAIEAAQKAQQVATELAIEVRAAEELARHQESLLDKKP